MTSFKVSVEMAEDAGMNAKPPTDGVIQIPIEIVPPPDVLEKGEKYLTVPVNVGGCCLSCEHDSPLNFPLGSCNNQSCIWMLGCLC